MDKKPLGTPQTLASPDGAMQTGAMPETAAGLDDRGAGRMAIAPPLSAPHLSAPPPSRRTYSRRNLHGQVVHDLGHRILSGEFPPGSLLPSESDLCAAIGVSRTALREATKVLAAKGLIESRPKVGTRVRPHAAWNMLDPDILAWRAAGGELPDLALRLLEIREIFEPAVAELAARNHTDAQGEDMRLAWQDMADADSLEAWTAADLRFHQAILNATGNEFISALGATIEVALSITFDFSARRATAYKESLGQHRAVLDHILGRDAGGAKREMQALLGGTRKTVERSRAPAG